MEPADHVRPTTSQPFDPDQARACEPDQQWLEEFQRELDRVVSEGGFDTLF
jgi:hypothetical protein